MIFSQSRKAAKFFWILDHAGRRIRLLANFGIWIKIFTTIIFFLSTVCFAQLKSIKMEDTRNSLLNFYEGIELTASGYWEMASLKFKKALEHNPQNQEAYLCHVIISDIIDGKLSENTGTNIFIAIDAWAFSNNMKAKEVFDTILDTQKDYGLIYLFKGINEESLEAFEEAYLDYNKVIELAPDITYAFIKRGRLHARQGHNDQALRDFNQAIDMDSVYYAAYYERGTVYQTLKDYEKSIQDYERAHYLYPSLKQALHESLKICEGYNNLGMVFLKNKNYPEALQNFNDAIDWNPNFHEPYLNRGITFRNLRLFDAAISDFNKALELDSAKVDVYFNLALTYKEMDEVDITIDYFLKLKDIDPNHFQAYQMMGEIYYDQRHFDQAILMFEKVLSINNKNYWGYYWVALSYDAKRRYPEAIKAYEIFIKIAPEEYYDQKIKMYERAERLKRWIDKDKP
jgi:tetratricopeptide (TPR) repeat protein